MRDELLILLENFGEALSRDPIVTEYIAARDALNADVSAMALTREYRAQTMLLNNLQSDPDPDSLAIHTAQEKIAEMSQKMNDNDTLKRLNKAESEINDLINEINSRLTSYIAPSGGCSGSCSTCGGCG